MINRVRGNALPLCIRLTLDYKTSGGDVIEQYTPSASDMVAVALISYKSYPRQSVVENNYVKFDADNMPVGLYGIEVTINSGTVGEMRFYAREVLHIWESNSDMPADTDTIIKDDGSAVIVGATYYLAKGDVGLTGPQGEQGIQGTKGDKGDVGNTPQLKVIGNAWQVSYDNGATWASINAPASSLVRINGSTKMWETSSDNGATWESTGVSAISSNAEVVQTAGTSTTAVMSQKAVGDSIAAAKEALFRDIWNDACYGYGKYDTDTGFYKLNGLTDITYQQALDIYCAWNRNVCEGAYINSVKIRTNIPFGAFYKNKPASFWDLFQVCSNIEIIQLSSSDTQVNNLTNAFENCSKLKKILGVIRIIGGISYFHCFSGRNMLEDVSLNGVNGNVSFSYSPLISYDSLNYLVTNAANTTAITVTVHADTYAKLTDTAGAYPDWVALASTAAGKSISFATA